ncbi:MAG: tRNA uridine-5-carboxymethylaminomethyl(34) synthesis GTPase MnmE [Bacteroidales bacterium]|nr:tRNA uridine-5-carboxymethylaminomethyl(34) synthesis GTPase MnmE [Bacteroidales bacterium]MDY0333417.1 tRNA uridine-5-carboxymethylaminomethyl(34) synthesis GTPase MnmE [Bacteroidales bacterium]NCU36469.1 tRNA uridine-5-carboxymethylaminomethyl(34) synthesis GTPase MnmE [Candidatus Falkowbacteria bacterium]
MDTNDTICALATPAGVGAIAMIRLSGPESFGIIDQIFEPRSGSPVSLAAGYTLHLGNLTGDEGVIDEVMVSVFRQPHSYTGDDAIEISCHGSPYIQQKIIELLISRGARMATAGEFTMRAFINGKFDLAQAEAVADLIASGSKYAHDLALDQMRGGFSDKIKQLRQELLDFASLVELELDFAEEDVEFADRTKIGKTLDGLETEIKILLKSFQVGNVLKNGIPVAIIGKPNVGKSTLLNTILQEEKAIVSDIPGTTRDSIEDTIIIEGIAFRFIDTAGLRPSMDVIENIGIERTLQRIKEASIILFIFDAASTAEEVQEVLEEHRHLIEDPSKRIILIGNKIDLLIEMPKGFKDLVELETIFISAKRKENINLISDSLLRSVNTQQLADTTIVSNARHYEALSKSLQAIGDIRKGFDSNIPSDLVAIDIRKALHHLGTITGQITTDEILGNIFGKFCIGK